MRIVLFFLLIFSGATSIFSQSVRQYEAAGDRAFARKDFNEAVQRFAFVLEKEPQNLDVLYKYAECARGFHAFPIAEKSYSKIADSKQAGRFPLVNFRLGEVAKSQGNYEAARAFFKKFMTDGEADAAFLDKAKSEIETCEWAAKRLAEADKTTVKPLGREVNSAYSEFGAVGRGDTLFFSSYKFEVENSHKKPRPRTTKILASVAGGRGKSLGRNFPADDSTHVAHTTFSANGQRVYFTFCKNIGPSEIRCELWMTQKDKKNRWQKPVRLGPSVNQKGATATQPNLFVDKKTGRETLFFASDRPDGEGKLDIWQVALDSASGQPAGEPTNLAAINTAENEGTPFFHEPSAMLWFSGDGGWQGLGGWDIYSSKREADGRFSRPQHAAPPLNTSYNDLYFSLKTDGKSGFLASNRPGSMFLDEANKACCNDIFAVKMAAPPSPPEGGEKPPPTDTSTLVKKVPPTPEPPVPTVPPGEAPPKRLEDFTGLPLFFDNDEPDKRTRKTTTKQTYEASFWAYFEQIDAYRAGFSTGLAGAEQSAARLEIDDFFEKEVKRGYDRLFLLTDFLLRRLQDGESVEIFIKGFTSPRAESDYNVALGKRRISSVRNHFAAWGEGVLEAYLRSGKLKITETSFGETTAKKSISDKLDDRRGSVFNPEAARERRVEIVEIKSN